MSAAVIYSDAPARTIDPSALSSSRFLLPRERRYPFRDALGRVNVHLVAACLRKAEGHESEEVVNKLRAWRRHAQRALDARPEDEKRTLDEMCDDAVEDCDDFEPPGTVARERRALLHPEAHDDEVTADRAHLARCAQQRLKRGSKKRRLEAPAAEASVSSSERDEDDVYQVEEILEEDTKGGRGFLIRWLGWGAAHDSWEPEENVAPALVAAFREERAQESSHVGSDYMVGRKRMLWCASCALHMPSDSFSANMRRSDPANRSCLNHHYKTSQGAATHATPDRRRARRQSATSPSHMASPLPPPPPNRPSVSRSLAARGIFALDATSPVARLFQDK